MEEYKEEKIAFSTIAISKKYIYRMFLTKGVYGNTNPSIKIVYKRCDVITSSSATNTEGYEFIFENKEVAEVAFNNLIDEYNSSDENKIINVKNIINRVKIHYNEKYKNEVFYKSINE